MVWFPRRAKRSQECEPDTRHGSRPNQPTLRPLFLYVEGPSLPGRPAPVIGLDGDLYLDRVGAGGKPPGGASQAAAGRIIVEPHLLPVDVHVYVVPGQEAAVPVLHVGVDGGAVNIDVSGGAHRGYEDSAPRSTAARTSSAARSPPSPPSAHPLSTPPQ